MNLENNTKSFWISESSFVYPLENHHVSRDREKNLKSFMALEAISASTATSQGLTLVNIFTHTHLRSRPNADVLTHDYSVLFLKSPPLFDLSLHFEDNYTPFLLVSCPQTN